MKYTGQLNITAVRGTFTIDTELIGKMDPYLNIRIGENEFRTVTAKEQGKTPVWNQTFTCFINGEQHMEIEAWDDDGGNDDYLGKDTISLAQVFQQRQVNGNFPVYNKKHHEVGKMNIVLVFNPAGAPY